MLLKEFCCDEKKSSVDLEQELKKGDSVAICMEPFIGSMDIKLFLPKAFHGPILGSRQDEEETSTSCSSFHCHHLYEIPSDSTLISLKASSHKYISFFCLSHKDLSCSIKGKENHLLLHAQSGHTREANYLRHALIICSAPTIHESIHRCLSYGVQLTGGIGRLLKYKPTLPQWLNSIGWESPEKPNEHISHENICRSIFSLQKAGVSPAYVIINEGWQQLAINRHSPHGTPALASFQANISLFPGGLKKLIEQLKKLGVQEVGVWHALMGARGGIHPRLAQHYDLPPSPQGLYFLGYDLGKTFQFYYDYYAFLREQGVTFIRVGDQNSINLFCRDGMSKSSLYRNLQVALQAAASVQFNNAHLNSDCLCNDNLFYWSTSRIARCIDTKVETTTQKVQDSLYQSMWLKQIMHADMGSFNSQKPQAETLAILHTLGSAICSICDSPGKHDCSLLSKFCLPSGRLAKPDKALSLCNKSTFTNSSKPPSLCKAYTYKGNCGILALFHLDTSLPELIFPLSPSMVPQLKGNYFATYSYRSGFIGVFNYREIFKHSLKKEADILSFSPEQKGVAVIGCPLLFLPFSPILSTQYMEDSIHIHSEVKAPLFISCSRQVLEARCEDRVIPFDYDEKKQLLTLDSGRTLSEEKCFYTVRFEN